MKVVLGEWANEAITTEDKGQRLGACGLASIVGTDERGELMKHKLASLDAAKAKNFKFANSHLTRTDERREGKECVSTCCSRWYQYHTKNNQNTAFIYYSKQSNESKY